VSFPRAEQLNLAGWYHLAVFGLLIPWLAVRNRRKLIGKQLPLPNRLRHFRTTAIMLVVFAGVSIATARAQSIRLLELPLERLGAGLTTAAALYVVAVLGMRPRWRRAVERRARVVYLFMPDTAAERCWWIAVSVLAGIGEEITWRGVQTALLVPLTGSYGAAVLLSALSFGAAHMIQGWKSSAIIVLFGLGFSTIVWAGGTLLFAMAAHVAYDITAGLTYGRLGRELGYALPETAPVV
jgi:membrane protease YdiL (CAAX protease family)